MRIVTALAALGGALLAPAPAYAAAIIQTPSQVTGQPVNGFSSSLGTLTGVTLDVSVTSYRQFLVVAPAGSPPNTIGYSTNGSFVVRTPEGGATLGVLPIRGAGMTTPAYDPTVDEYAVSLVNFRATGAGSFQLDPAAFVDRGPFRIEGYDPDLFNTALGGTTITTSVASEIIPTAGRCNGNFIGTNGCTFYNLSLIYEYTPFAAAVPEPGTWTTMILGFGAIGFALRRRPARRGALAA